MQDAEFSDEFCAFLQGAIPTVDAAELLLLLSGEPTTCWRIADVIARLAPTLVLEERDALRSLNSFGAVGLVARCGDQGWHYRPATASLADNVELLRRAYETRPVTLIRMIYALRDSKLKSFADAFRLRRR